MIGNKNKIKMLLGKFFRAEGYTLIEMIVVVGVFVIVVVTVVDVYLVYSRAQNAAQQRQNILNEVSYEVDRIAQDIRTGEIKFSGTVNYGSGSQNYYEVDGSAGIALKEQELVIYDDGNIIIYVFDDTGEKAACEELACSPATECIGLYKYAIPRYGSSQTTCEPVFNDSAFSDLKMNIIDAGFYITPSYDPFPDSDDDCKNGTFNGYFCSCSSGSDCWSGSCSQGFCISINYQPRVTFYIVVQDLSEETVKNFTIQTTASSRIYRR